MLKNKFREKKGTSTRKKRILFNQFITDCANNRLVDVGARVSLETKKQSGPFLAWLSNEWTMRKCTDTSIGE
jgi:hypothetical protein